MMHAFFQELWVILVESSLWLLLGFAIAGAIHALVPREWMLRHLSGGGFWPVAKASLLGIPLPLCSCSVIPVAAGLRSQGASKGASAAFAISTPQTGEESIPITWALFGPVYAFTRPIVAVITALIAGLLIDATARNDEPKAKTKANADPKPGTGDAQVAAGSSCCSASTPKPEPGPGPAGSCCAAAPSPARTSIGEKFVIALRHGFGTMVMDLVGWLSVGLILAALIGALVPADWIAQHIGTGILPKLIMLLIGIPLYICATSSTPLAWGLVAAGLSPGAALVMLLSGPATNVATMSWLLKDLGVRALAIYLAVIAAVALAAGILFDAFFTRFVHIATGAELHQHATGFGVKQTAAVMFIGLMLGALVVKLLGMMGVIKGGSKEHEHQHEHHENQDHTASACCSSANDKPSTSCGCHA